MDKEPKKEAVKVGLEGMIIMDKIGIATVKCVQPFSKEIVDELKKLYNQGMVGIGAQYQTQTVISTGNRLRYVSKFFSVLSV